MPVGMWYINMKIFRLALANSEEASSWIDALATLLSFFDIQVNLTLIHGNLPLPSQVMASVWRVTHNTCVHAPWFASVTSAT